MSSNVPTKWTAELVLYYRNRNNTCLKWKKFRLTISSWHGNQLLSIFLYNNWKMHFMFSSAKPSFCSNFQTCKKRVSKKTSIQFFFPTKELASTFSTRFALDRLFMSLESESNWAQIFLQMAKYTLDDGYEFQIKRLLGLRNSKIK